jgi:ribosome-associated heat shock protein Hsp15
VSGIRLDKYLWHTRLVRTRSLAQQLCEDGLVLVGDKPVLRPAQSVRIGDRITLTHGGFRRCLEVTGLGSRRGPPAEARLLYRELEPARRLAETEPGWTPLLADAEP